MVSGGQYFVSCSREIQLLHFFGAAGNRFLLGKPFREQNNFLFHQFNLLNTNVYKESSPLATDRYTQI